MKGTRKKSVSATPDLRFAESSPAPALPLPDAPWTGALGRVHLHSCEQMTELPDGVVDLTVTSPPYWNAIAYDVHAADSRAEYRPRARMNYDDYLEFLRGCFREVFRVHREGSFCAVVIGTVLLDGRHVPLPFHFVSLMEELGWEFHQDIVWSKCTGGVKRAGSTIQNPYPGYFYPNLMMEYILVFRKPGERKIHQGRSAEEREASRNEIESVFTRDVANNVWHIAPVPPRQLDHPCPFPEELAYRLIRWYSYRGDVVLDPFCGVGTTPKVAAQTGRHWIACEILKKYADLTKARVKEPLVLRKQLIVNLDRIDYGEPLERKSTKRAPFRSRKRAGKDESR